MTDFNKADGQNPQLLQYNLADGFSELPLAHQALLNQMTTQPQGSMLLDSINAYLVGSQSNFQTIKEANEADQYEQQRNLDLVPSQDKLNLYVPKQQERSQIAQFKNILNEYSNSQQAVQQIASMTKFIKLTNLHQPNNFTLDFSHYKNKIDQSLSKIDLNSSLVVEISNEKVASELTEDIAQANSPIEANPECFTMIPINQSVDILESKDEKLCLEPFSHTNQGVKMSIEEQRQLQAISNQSIDSNLILSHLPLQQVTQEKSNVCASHNENNEQQAEQYIYVAQGKVQELMEIQHHLPQNEEIPMDIENNYPNHTEENNYVSNNAQIPMQIESIGFPTLNHNLNIIFIDPIKSQMNPPQEHQRVEQQEILDCITRMPAQSLEREVVKEFTFGKQQFQGNHMDKLKTEAHRHVSNPAVQQENHTQLITQGEISINRLNNVSNQSSFCQEGNNLSLNVEHQNNYSEVLREIQEMPPFNSLKNESHDMNANEPLLAELQTIPNPHQKVVQSIYLPCQQENSPSNKNEEKNVLQESIIIIPDSEKQPQQSCKYTVIINQIQNKVEKPKIIRLNQGVVINQTIFPYREKPIEFVDSHQKAQDNKQKLSQNKACNNNQGNKSIPLRDSPKPYENERPQIVIHNDNYHLSNERYAQSQQQNFVDNIINLQQNPYQQQNMQMYPCINVNFRNNEMSVSIVGPAIGFSNEQSANKNQTASINLNQTPQQLSYESFNQSSNLKATKSFIDSSLEENASHQKKATQKAQKLPQKQKQELKSPKQSLQQKIIEISSLNEKYNHIINEAQNYLLEFNICSQVVHRQFELLVNLHVFLRFTPQPKTQLGIQLFKNGLFLIALAKLVTRSSQSPFIVCYIYEYLEGAFGHLVEKNSYVFKNQCQRAKKTYQSALQKKYTEMINTQKTQVTKEKPLIRPNLAENCFLQPKCEKKDSFCQVTPQVSPKKITCMEYNEVNEVNEVQQPSLVIQKKVQLQPPLSKSKKHDDKKTHLSSEQITIKPQVTPSKKLNGKISPKQDIQKNSKKKQLQLETSSEQVSKVDYRSNQLKIKKNIEEIRNSIGSSGKKNDTQDASNDQASKFSELYLKYRKIRQTKKSDLPIQNSSVKRSIVEQALKGDSQEIIPEKKPTKKVVFTDQVIVNNPIENDQSNEQDVGRKRRKKKSRSKKDDSVEKSEQQDNQITFKKKINSKK